MTDKTKKEMVAALAPPSRATALAEIIRKRTGDKESVQLLGSGEIPRVESISTGSLGLDFAIGIGGIPLGRIIEVYGPESSGKTTVALQTLGYAQHKGGTATFVDAEHALDLKYAAALGVNVAELLVSQPMSGEEALTILEIAVSNGQKGDIAVVDSVAALAPKAEIEGEMGASHMGLQARMMGQALRKIVSIASERQVTVIFINQLRQKIGVMFGNPETTPGGNALKFYASVRLDVRKISTEKTGEGTDTVATSNRVRVKVVKNKVAPPFRQVEFDIRFGQGVDYRGEILDFGDTYKIVEKSGSWYSYKGERLGQGRENAIAFLAANPEIEKKIALEVRAQMFPSEKCT